MAFTESDRVKIRMYMGAGSLFLQQFPKLEYAMTAVQSIADGGIKADSSTETLIKGLITKLDTIEVNLSNLQIQMHVIKAGADDIQLDTGKGVFLLRSEGRRTIGALSIALGTAPAFDYFSPREARGDDFHNPYHDM